jgi:hypothetical protein
MSEKTKPQAKSEGLTKEQLEKVAGGFDIEQVMGVTPPAKPPTVTLNPFE